MSCCPPNSEPARAATTSCGTMTSFQGTELYVTGPATAKVGVIVYPDIFGPDSGRTKEDADRLGKELGYAVVLVDCCGGMWMDPDGYAAKFAAWAKAKDFDTDFAPRIQDAVTYLQQEAHVEQICSYGYCYGGWVGARFCAQLTSPIFKGHVSFHPSWIVETILNGNGAIEKLAQDVKIPQLLLAAENDIDAVSCDGAVHKILKARADVAKLSDVIDFPDVKHGWVNRGDLDDPVVQAAVNRAWGHARAFFQAVLAN